MAALDMPQDMPDISMPELEDEDIDQLDEITLAEAIREARRRKRIRRMQPASARQASEGNPPVRSTLYRSYMYSYASTRSTVP